jgi:hypothetical protein
MNQNLARLGLFGIVLLPLGLSGCGIGTAAAVLGLDSDDPTPEPEQIQMLTEDSMPRLSREILPEPASEFRLATTDSRYRYVYQFVQQDPAEFKGEQLEFRFSKDADAVSATDLANIQIHVQRPGTVVPRAWESVPVRAATLELQNPRKLVVELERRLRFDGLYSAKLSNIRDVSGATTIPTTTSYFLTREGVWSEPEILTFGDRSFGTGVTITKNLDMYTTVEAKFDLTLGTTQTASFSRARFGEPWLVPEVVWQSPFEAFDDQYQMNSGGLFFTSATRNSSGAITSRPLACFQWQEGKVSEAPDQNIRLRAPITIQEANSAGFDFGPVVVGQPFPNDNEGVVDQGDSVLSPELLAPHLSFRGRFAGEGARIVTGWWGLTNASGMTYGRQRVFVNDIRVTAPSTTNWAAHDWGAAERLATETNHASWPYIVEMEDTSVLAVWWEASNVTDLLARDLGAGGRYRMALYPPFDPNNPGAAQTWFTPVTFAIGAGLRPITDVHAISATQAVIFTSGQSGPEAQVLDISTPIPQLSAPTGPMGNYDLVLRYESRPLAQDFGPWRGLIYASTPRATRVGTLGGPGARDFVVRWFHSIPNMNDRIELAEYNAATESWGTPVDFSAINSQGSPNIGEPSLSIDELGWATLVWPERVSTTETFVRARRANLFIDRLRGLENNPSPGPPLQTRSDELLTMSLSGTFAMFPGLASTHPTGATAATWNFGIGLVHGENLLGTAIVRFQ